MHIPKIATLSFAALLLLGAGCASSGSTSTTSSPEDSSTDTSASTDAAVTLPYNFPTDVPIYPNGTIVGADASNGAASMSISTTDLETTAKSWYESELSAENWTNGGMQDVSDITMEVFTKGDEVIGIDTHEEGDQSIVSVTEINAAIQ